MNDAAAIFPGDSEMSRRMRTFDWTETPLGAPDGWPQNLRAAVRILLTSSSPMFVWWGEQLISLYNDGCAKFLDTRHPASLGRPAAEVWPPLPFCFDLMPNDGGGFGGVLCRVTEETSRTAAARETEREGRELERRIVERTSALEASNSQLARDVSERRTAEQQIKALFRRLILAQEDERRRIARDIHDRIGQQMTALRMNLAALRTKAAGDAAIEGQAARAEQLAEELDESLDLLTVELRPSVLEHFGLAAALENLVTDWTAQSGIEAALDVHDHDGSRPPYDVEFNLYRLVQEALHNVATHADATDVRLTLSREGQYMALTIGDNGRGFDPQAVDHTGAGGLGLLGMRERATLAGGELEVDTEPGKGTTIRVRVPVGGPALARAE